MNCERAATMLSERFKNVLDPGGERELDQHLADCTECRAEVDGLCETWAILNRLDEDEEIPSDRMRNRLFDTLAAYAEVEAQSPHRASIGELLRSLAQLWSRHPVLQFGFAAAMLVVSISSAVGVHTAGGIFMIGPPGATVIQGRQTL